MVRFIDISGSMVPIEFMLTLGFFSILLAALCAHIYFRRTYAYADDVFAVSVEQVVETFEKLCPLSISKKWILQPIGNGAPRCWYRMFPMKILDNDVNVYGSSVLIRAPLLCIIEMIADIYYWPNWNPLAPKNLTLEQYENPILLKGNIVMHAARFVNKFDGVEMYRFCHSTENMLGWILFWNAKKIHMSFFLIQRLGLSATGQCLLTYIQGCCTSSCKKNIMEQHIFNLNSIKEEAEITVAPVMPFRLLYPSGNKERSRKTVKNNSDINLSQTRSLKSEDVTQLHLPMLLPYVQKTFFFPKKLKTFDLVLDFAKSYQNVHATEVTQSIQSSVAVAKSNSLSEDNIHELGLYCMDYARIAEQEQKEINYVKPSSDKDLTELEELSDAPISVREDNTSTSSESLNESICSTKRRSASEMNILLKKSVSSVYGKKHSSMVEFPLTKERRHSCVDIFGNYDDTSTTTVTSDPSVSEFEVLLPKHPISGQRITDFKTKGNYCASELQAEVLKASSINVHSSFGDRAVTSDGWSFHSSVKGITVLSKSGFSGSLKTLSFMCDMEISVDVDDVWKVIKNPRSRFICDESVKEVKILEEITTDQKIVFVYHERSHLLKKEAVDFCILHTERQEMPKYYVAFHSIEFENCPLMDGVTRGALLPSGFVVEPGATKNNPCKVKFLYQVIVNNPSSAFFHELSYSVIEYMCNLKNYLISKPT